MKTCLERGGLPSEPEVVGKIFREGSCVVNNTKIDSWQIDLDKCFMELDENCVREQVEKGEVVEENNFQECPTIEVDYVDEINGVWYDESERTWRQECDERVAWVSDSKSVNVFVNVNNQRLKMSVDSGSKETLMPIFMFKDFFRNLRLTPSKVMLTSVEGETIKVVGECIVQVTDTKGNVHDLNMVVVDSRSLKVALLGRKWLDAIYPDWRKKLCSLVGELSDELVFLIDSAGDKVVNLRKMFPRVFSKNKSSAIEGFEAQIMLKEDAVPVIAREYPIPFYLRERVIKKLWEDVESGKARIVTQPKWASPMFAIEKPNKDVRIIIDFKRTVNPQLKMDYFPMPNPADLWGILDANAQCFVKLDCSEACKQMSVSENSRQYLVANTPIGFLEYQFLYFGLANAPALFQHMMYVILKGIQGVWNFLDDTIIWGRDMGECNKRLMEVLKRLETHNVKINENKCEWFVKEVTYLGFKLDKEGRHILTDRIRPILDAPAPENVHQLRSYLGTFNVYKSFLPDTNVVLRPLHELLQAYREYKWTDECQQAFEKSKKMLLSHKMLVHYNPNLPLVLITDASPKWNLSCVMS